MRLPIDLVEDDAARLAPSVGLIHVTDDEPGISRVRRGTGFSYHGPDGALLGDRYRDRIELLAVPPAWSDVWIAMAENGYLQATGRDDLERKQYRYHDAYRELQEERKFLRLAWFAPALDDLRRHVDDALARPPGDEARAHATVLRLLDQTLVRIGRPVPSEVTGSRGALSLTSDHLDVDGDTVRLDFTAKGGAERDFVVSDPVLAQALADAIEDAPERPFSYVGDDGSIREVTPRSVSERITDITGSPFSARDFRTWGGTVAATEELLHGELRASDDGPDRPDLAAYDAAAERLGNTRAVARSAYVAPAVVAAHDDGTLEEIHRRTRTGARLSRTERTVMRVLKDDARARALR